MKTKIFFLISALLAFLFFLHIEAIQAKTNAEDENITKAEDDSSASITNKTSSVTYRNLSIVLVTDDLNASITKLHRIIRCCKGSLSNYNINCNNASGSVSAKIQQSMISSFLIFLGNIGKIQEQSLSTSDYTQYMEDAEKKLKIFEILDKIDLTSIFSGMDIKKEDRIAIKNELQNLISGQLKSYDNSKKTYEDYKKFININLTLKAEKRPSNIKKNNLKASNAEVKDKNPYAPITYKYILIISGMLIFIGFIIFFIKYAKKEKGTKT